MNYSKQMSAAQYCQAMRTVTLIQYLQNFKIKYCNLPRIYLSVQSFYFTQNIFKCSKSTI